MNLAFIPARGGSKRIPRKNILPLGGKPLLAWTVEAAQQSGQFGEIVVSSDDDEVLAIAEQIGARADRRPAALGGDSVRFVQVLAEFLERAGELNRFEQVAVLLPTCPFRTGADIQSCFRVLEKNSDVFVVTVSDYEFPPDFACDLDAKGALSLRHPEVFARSTQSQSVAPAVHPNGAVFLGQVRRFLAERTFYAAPMVGVPLPPERALDIDHRFQLEVARALLHIHHP